MAANQLFGLNLEAAAPALLAGCLVFAAQPRLAWWRAGLVVFPLPIVWAAQAASLAPLGLLMAAALPPILLAALSTCDNRLRLTGRPLIAAAILVLLGAIGWAITPPKMHDAGYVVLPAYDKLLEMEQANEEFHNTDVVLILGANDVVNPAAKSDPSSPIYGMPILDVELAKTVIVNKRSMKPGYAGIENDLFFRPKTSMLFGDAKKVLQDLIAEIKSI